MNKKVLDWWNGLQKIVKIGMVVALIAIIGILVATQSTPDTYQVLYTNLDQKDASQISKELVRSGVSYKSEENGTTILVDTADVAKVRMNLATLGLPREGNPGFELLEDTSIGETRFDKDRKYERALKGQLEHDLVYGIDVVESATVTLSLSEQGSVFREKGGDSKATAVLSTRAGGTLSESQIKGVQNFIAGAVPGLEATDVVVLGENGAMLSQLGGEGTAGSGNVSKQQEIIDQTETRIKNDIMHSLSKVFGYEHVTLNVRARINFDEIITNIEKYDPEGTLVSREQYNEHAEKSNEQTEVGMDANGEVPNYNLEEGNTETLLQNKEEIIENFEVGKTLETIKKNPELTDLSVVLWIDKTMEEEELNIIRNGVAKAAGLQDKDRDGVYENGDVEVIPVFFQQNLEEKPAEKPVVEKSLWDRLFGDPQVRIIVLGTVAVLFLLWLLTFFALLGRKRKKKERMRQEAERVVMVEHAPMPDGSTSTGGSAPAGEERATNDTELLSSISDAKKRTFVRQESEEDLYKKELMDRAKEGATGNPRKTSEYIQKLIGE